MKKKITAVQFGLGPIGLECIKLAGAKPWLKVLGGIDVDPNKLGKDLRELTRSDNLRGLRIVRSVDDLAEKPEIIFHTAVSRFKDAYEQIEPLIAQGISVVSSCEELVFPQLKEPSLAAKLDKLCQKTGARVVGTGVNPGFVMDLLPVFLTAVCKEVRAIHVRRVVNASTRREQLQKKIGSGLPPEEFRRRFRAGKAGHAGLRESLALIANALGWKIGNIRETARPVIAKNHIRTQFLQVSRGKTCGLHQRAEAKADNRVRITLDLKMFLDAENPHDSVEIEGNPPLDLILQGGIAGDHATVAALVNTAPRLLRAKPGLRLMTELPLA